VIFQPLCSCGGDLIAEVGTPVVYVATGTLVRLTKERVQRMAAALSSLSGCCFLWSLKEVRAPQDMNQTVFACCENDGV
jgi:hypothetical protein